MLKGWVQKRRDLGGVISIDLRDHKGVVQAVSDPEINKEAWEIADKCRSEYVIEVTGVVRRRGEDAANPKMTTDEFEVIASEITTLNQVEILPSQIEDDQAISGETYLKYHYLDLRCPKMAKNIRLKDATTEAIRHYLDDNDFPDIKILYLGKSTPEGAGDYLAPLHIHVGHFHALPQSSQLFKQLLINAGFDRCYQIVCCFRDEDLRGNHQFEFTQVDIETMFLIAEETQTCTEGLITKVMKEVRSIEVTLPSPYMTYDEAMARHGNDKPDTRFKMELIDLSETVKKVEFKVFQMAPENGGIVKALSAKGTTDRYSRKDMNQSGQYARQFGAKGLAWLRVEEDGLKSLIAKFMGEATEAIIETTDTEPGDLLMFGAGKSEIVAAVLGAIRTRLGKELGPTDESKSNFLWVIDRF